jgi:oxygen-independent coproporphyrinogen-3 oxidase
MFGLPAQSLEFALQDLEIAVSYKLDHISWYQLTIEQNTLFYHQKPSHLPNDDLQWTMQTAGQRYLAKQGYQQYEISAYAKPEQQCQHNLNYWKFGDYLGIGAGAHGKLSLLRPTNIIRSIKSKSPEHYLKNTTATLTKIAAEELPLEFLMNQLRLKAGFSLEHYESKTGLESSSLEPALSTCVDQSLLIKNESTYYCTEKGWNFLDEILKIFIN